MSCCNIKVLSYIVAWAHIVCSVISGIGCVIAICMLYSDSIKGYHLNDVDKMALTVVFIIGLLSCCVIFAASVMLVVGIKQIRHRLMAFYVWLTYISLVIITLGVIGIFIMQLVNKASFGTVILSLLRNCLYLALEVLIFSPIYLLYQKMRAEPMLPEQHGLSTNEPLNKPHYVHGGHI